MFNEENKESLKQKQRAAAVCLSLFLHGLGVCGLLFAGLYPANGLESSFQNVVFLNNIMTLPDEPYQEMGKSRVMESRPAEPVKTEISASIKPKAAAAPPAPPKFPEEEQPPLPSPPAMPALPIPDILAHNSLESILKPGAMALPLGTANGAKAGMSASGIYGRTGLPTGGYGKPGDARSPGSGGHGSGNGGERIVGADGGPFLIRLNPPVYPIFARRTGKEGTVILSMLIDESGRLRDARVIEKAGYGFDESALEAVRLSLFKPALENGIPISCRARMAIRFQLAEY